MSIDQTPPPATNSSTTEDPKPQEPESNDNSNPQQGTGIVRHSASVKAASHPHSASFTTLKIPPTKKDARKLFVGGLPSDATGDEFRKFFEQFGTVIDSIVMYDHETHRSRGFGFVTFKDPESSRRVLSMGNAKNGQLEDDNNNTNTNNDPPVARLEMRGKKIEVKAAEPKESTPRHYDERHGRNRECPPFPPPVNPDMMIMYGPNDPNLYYNYNAPAQYYAPHAFTTGYVAPMYYPGQFAQHYPPVVPMVEGYHQYMDAAYAYVPFATPIPPIYEQPYEQLHEQPYGITSDMQPVPPTISAKEGAEEVEGATQ